MTHTCHARGCATPVRPELLMCAAHWRKVPLRLQQMVRSAYRPGQCDDKRPSLAWHDAASAAIGMVALLEDQPATLGEVRRLVEFGYEMVVLAAWIRKHPETKKAAERVIVDMKRDVQK